MRLLDLAAAADPDSDDPFERRWAEYARLMRQRPDRQPMNTEGVAVDDATSPCGLAQTTTPSGADPQTLGARNADQTTTGPEASGNGSNGTRT